VGKKSSARSGRGSIKNEPNDPIAVEVFVLGKGRRGNTSAKREISGEILGGWLNRRNANDRRNNCNQEEGKSGKVVMKE
jgi:hypothetical protein